MGCKMVRKMSRAGVLAEKVPDGDAGVEVAGRVSAPPEAVHRGPAGPGVATPLDLVEGDRRSARAGGEEVDARLGSVVRVEIGEL